MGADICIPESLQTGLNCSLRSFEVSILMKSSFLDFSRYSNLISLLFQSTLPVRGATAEMHKKIVRFCERVSRFGIMYGGFHRDARRNSACECTISPSGGCEPGGESMCAWCSQLDDEGFLGPIGGLAAKVFDLLLILVAEVVKPQAVPFLIHDGA